MKKMYSILCLFMATAVFVSCSEDDDIVLSSLNNITAFEINFEGVEADDITYDLGNSITISVPFATNIEGLVATIAVDALATVVPASGAATDYVDGAATVFTVTAEDGTTKTYDVTISVRGEVGSGSQLATYTLTQDWFGTTVTEYTYAESNFVNAIKIIGDDWGTEVITDIVFVYNDKNQVIEKKIEADKQNTIYTYNELGQIISASESIDAILKYTYTYEYNVTTGVLLSITRIEEANTDPDLRKYVISFVIENGNVTQIIYPNEIHKAAYDDKNNPFIGMYPKAFGVINSGIELVSVNNPITGNLATNGVAYTYNDDAFPISASYANYGGGQNVKKTFTYITQ